MTNRINSSRGRSRRRPTRVLFLSEIPTPYRLPLYRRLMEQSSLEIEVAFCAAGEPDRPWSLEDELASVPHRVLRGLHPRVRMNGDTFVYEINPGIFPLLHRSRPDLLVVGGYGVFAEQIALVVAPLLRIPLLIHSETHLGKRRPSWLSWIKRRLLPLVFRRAAGGLATGSAAADYLAAHGIPRERIRIFPNTIDVDTYRAEAAAARRRASDLRLSLGLPEHYVLFVGRFLETKGFGEFVAALDLLGSAAPDAVVVGMGPLEQLLDGRPQIHRLGFRERAELVELYALADWCVVPSRAETWGVVVNEALACGCPVIATDAVGAAHDLVRDGVDGRVIPTGDVTALAEALASPPPPCDVSRGPISEWTYDFGVEQFLEAVELAVSAT
jgi:glycosyltransferase involved in cell wall biosynthesis